MPLVLTLVIAVGWLTYTLTLGARSPQLGLDLQGGTSVVLGVKAGQSATSAQLDQAISIIRRRVDGLGVAEPEITRQGKFIVVSLPGVKDSQRAIELVGRTAKLQFRPTCTTAPPHLADATYMQALDPSVAGACVKPADAGPTESTTTTTDTSLPGSALPGESSLGIPPAGHLSVSQQPTSTSDTTTTAIPGATDTTVPGATDTTVPGATDSTTSTTVAANPLACGQAGEQASVTSDADPVVAKEDRDKDGTIDDCPILGPVALSGEAVSSARAAIPQGSMGSTSCRDTASRRTKRAPAARRPSFWTASSSRTPHHRRPRSTARRSRSPASSARSRPKTWPSF
jgi:preprotein translocase subunit SecD